MLHVDGHNVFQDQVFIGTLWYESGQWFARSPGGGKTWSFIFRQDAIDYLIEELS